MHTELDAIDVARWILKLASDDPACAARGLTLKQLQKILYYVQGLSLGRRDRAVFREDIRAWREGPVIREVWDVFKLTPRLLVWDQEEPVIPDAERAFIASVWEDYKHFSERELIEKTHAETPWVAARHGFLSHEASDVPIPRAQLREFFSQPSPDAISPDELRALAMLPENAPPASWLEEPDPFENGQ